MDVFDFTGRNNFYHNSINLETFVIILNIIITNHLIPASLIDQIIDLLMDNLMRKICFAYAVTFLTCIVKLNTMAFHILIIYYVGYA